MSRNKIQGHALELKVEKNRTWSSRVGITQIKTETDNYRTCTTCLGRNLNLNFTKKNLETHNHARYIKITNSFE